MHSVWIITIHIIMVSVLKCHIIYLLFKKSKSILLVEIVLCWDWSLSHVQHHPFSEIYICRSLIIDFNRKFLFLDFAARKRNIFSRPAYWLADAIDMTTTTAAEGLRNCF
jgi:hypothetical protein